MSRGIRNDTGWKTFDEVSGQTVVEYTLVKQVGEDVQPAGAGEGSLVVGASQEPTDNADTDTWAIAMTNKPGTVLVTVAAAVSAGDKLYCAAAGKATPVINGNAVLVALEDGSGDGSVIECRWANAGEVNGTAFDLLPLKSTGITAAELAAATGLTAGMYARSSTGGLYQLVLNDNVNGAAIGTPLGIRTAGTLTYDCSDDLAASSALGLRGVAASTFASTDVYGWMLVEGDLEAEGITLVTDGNVAALDMLFWGADGVFHGLAIGGTAADHKFIGQATKADATTVLTAGEIFRTVTAV